MSRMVATLPIIVSASSECTVAVSGKAMPSTGARKGTRPIELDEIASSGCEEWNGLPCILERFAPTLDAELASGNDVPWP